MKKINKTRFALLGILFDKPRSGYDIRKFMLESTNHFWEESDASIYPMLKTLAAESKVTAKSEFVGKRERTIFEITQSGKDEFLAWMAHPTEDEENRRNELLLKLFLGANAPQEEIVKQLALHQQKVLEIKKVFKHIEAMIVSQVDDAYPHKRFWLMSLRYGVLHTDAEHQWLNECLNVLEKK